MKRIIRRAMSGMLAAFVFLAGADMAAPARAQANMIQSGTPLSSAIQASALHSSPRIMASRAGRLWGLDRYKTAQAIAEAYNNGKVDHVILASGENFPDALAASVLAAKLKAPILLVNASADATAEAFDYVKGHLNLSGSVYLIGGTGVIGGDFRERLRSMGYGDNQVRQIGGIDRYETGALLTEYLQAAKGTPVFLVTGEDFSDALTVSSFAAHNGWPILLTGKDALPNSVKEVLKNLAPEKVYLIGDSTVVSSEIEAAVKAQAPTALVQRLSGADRYATEAAVLKEFAPNPSEVYVASGSVFADALSGSILAAKTGSPIILVDPTIANPPAAVSGYLRGLTKPRVNVFGGTGAVSDALTGNLEGMIDPVNAESPVIVPKDIKGIGSFNTYRVGSNVSVETNLNMDLLNIMAAAGSGFTHFGYLAGDENNPLFAKMKQHFRAYTNSAEAKDFYAQEAKESSSGPTKKIPNIPVIGMLSSGELLKDTLINPAEPSLQHSMFRERELSLAELREKVRTFAQESQAEEFFKESRSLYNELIDGFVQNTLSFNHVQRLQEFYGTDLSKDKFRVVLTVTENGGSAMDYQNADGTTTYVNIMNPSGEDRSKLNVLYHETAHNFYLPIWLQNRELVHKYAAYTNVLGYYSEADDFERRLNETLARVVTAIMLEQYHGKDMAIANLGGELANGWKNTDNIYYLVKNKYLTNRDQYKTFGDFLPVILDYIKAVGTNQPFDIGPVEKLNLPQNGLVLGEREEAEKLAGKTPGMRKLGNAWTDQASLDQADLIVLFDYPGFPLLPGNVTTLFNSLKTGDANYLNVKQVNGKTLVFIKAQSKDKLMSMLDKIERVYVEQYVVFP